MKHALKLLILVLLVVLCRQTGLALPPMQSGNVTVSGTLTGRATQKPLAKATVTLGRLQQDADGRDVDLLLTEFTAVTDDKGYFQIKGVPAGSYTIVYRPAGGAAVKPAVAKGGGKLSVAKLAAVIRTFMPMMRSKEVGLTSPFENRPWSTEFTLLKGHTLFCDGSGEHMRIWNATVRSGRQGPYLEMRRNKIWKQDIQKDTQLKVEAWSF